MKKIAFLICTLIYSFGFAKVFWQNRFGDAEVVWSTEDLKFLKNGKIIHSERAENDQLGCVDEKEEVSENEASGAFTNYNQSNDLQIRSVVGNVISIYGVYNGYTGGAHPLSRATLTAYLPDYSKTSLLDYFSEKDLLGALLKDVPLKKSIMKNNVQDVTKIKSLDELFAVVSLADREDGILEKFSFNKESLNDFSFYDLKKDKVAVRIGLSHSAEVYRGQYTELGLWLPIPEKLRADLGNAKSKKMGFLISNRPKDFTNLQMTCDEKKKGHKK